jgi:hypothetical protein
MSADLGLPVGLASRLQPHRRISLAHTCNSPRSCVCRWSPSRKRITCIARILPRALRKPEWTHLICSCQPWMMEETLDRDSREIIWVAPFNDPVEPIRNHIISIIVELCQQSPLSDGRNSIRLVTIKCVIIQQAWWRKISIVWGISISWMKKHNYESIRDGRDIPKCFSLDGKQSVNNLLTLICALQIHSTSDDTR